MTGQDDSGLSYSWNFDGAAPSSTLAAPPVTFAERGQFNVTVQVTDATGRRWCRIDPDHRRDPARARHRRTQAERRGHEQEVSLPDRAEEERRPHAGGPAGKPNNGQSTTPGKSNTSHRLDQPRQPSTTSNRRPRPRPPRFADTATHPPPPARTTPSRSAPLPHRGATRPRRAARPARVTGLLVSDVTPLPADVSPLVHTVPAAVATAPPARRAIRTSLLPAFGAALAVVLLLGLGAGRELRSRRGWRALRFGS